METKEQLIHQRASKRCFSGVKVCFTASALRCHTLCLSRSSRRRFGVSELANVTLLQVGANDVRTKAGTGTPEGGGI